MAASQVAIPGTHEQFQQWVAEKGKSGSSKDNVSQDSVVVARVSLCCSEPGGECIVSGHEIMEFDTDSSYADLMANIKTQFLALQKADDASARTNVRHCLWSKNHEIRSIKVNWSGVTGNGWTDNGDSFLTHLNTKTALRMMAKRNAIDSMTVTISASN